MSSRGLKPCPFCGSEEIQFSIEGFFQPWKNEGMKLWYRCSCHGCGAEGVDDGVSTDMTKAIKAWNQRAGEHHED